MDELNLLQQMRADAPDPSADVLDDIRRKLTDGAELRVVPMRRRPTPMRRRVVIAAVTAAAVTAGLIALTNGSAHPPQHARQAPALAPAAALLDDAATRALTDGDPELAPGQYRYVRVHVQVVAALADESESEQNPVDRPYMGTYLNEAWIPAGGVGTWYLQGTGPSDVRFFRAEDERFIRATHLNLNNPTIDIKRPDSDSGGSWTKPTAAWFAALPRDPDALLARIYADLPADRKARLIGRDDGAFNAIQQVLASGIGRASCRERVFSSV